MVLIFVFGIEKNKTDRQYLRAAAFPADEVHGLPDNQYCIYKKSSYQGRNRILGNVPLHFGTDKLLLGDWDNTIAAASVSPQPDLQKNGRIRDRKITGDIQRFYSSLLFQSPLFWNGTCNQT